MAAFVLDQIHDSRRLIFARSDNEQRPILCYFGCFFSFLSHSLSIIGQSFQKNSGMIHKVFFPVVVLAFLPQLIAQSLRNPAVANALSSECVQTIKSDCIPTASTCAAAICYLCTSLGISPSIEPCCASTKPEDCFATNYVTGQTALATVVSVASAPIPSYLATLSVARETSVVHLSSSCQSQAAVYESCKINTPEFDDLSFSDLQSCLCTVDGKAAPSIYDNYYSGCLLYNSVFDPAEYSALPPIGATGFSGSAGSQTVLGSRPCEAWAEVSATRTNPSTQMMSSTPAIPTATGAVVTHGGVAVVNPKVSVHRIESGTPNKADSSPGTGAADCHHGYCKYLDHWTLEHRVS